MTSRFPRPVRRAVNLFTSDPASIRNASILMVVTYAVVVLIASAVIWLFDSRDYPNYGTALWFTLQTATTVGYGDVTPKSPVGRVVAGVVMVVAIAFIAIVTALITSLFVEAAQRRRQARQHAEEPDGTQLVLDRLDELNDRLSRIEASMAAAGRPDPD